MINLSEPIFLPCYVSQLCSLTKQHKSQLQKATKKQEMRNLTEGVAAGGRRSGCCYNQMDDRWQSYLPPGPQEFFGLSLSSVSADNVLHTTISFNVYQLGFHIFNGNQSEQHCNVFGNKIFKKSNFVICKKYTFYFLMEAWTSLLKVYYALLRLGCIQDCS